MNFTNEYDISNGSALIKLPNIKSYSSKAAIQVETSADFNGTTSTIEFKMSNVFDLPDAQWHDFTDVQDPLSLTVNDSHLITTCNHYTGFLALQINAGDATTGTLTISQHVNTL